jgi:YidC/Oxa1 family membrane protein insertase
MKFLKIFDLGAVPFSCFTEKSWALAPLLLIPVVLLASQYLIQWISSPTRNKKKDKSADPTGRSMKMFMLLMPLLTFGIAMSAPAGLGFYWTVSNILSLLQTLLINKFFLKKKEEV